MHRFAIALFLAAVSVLAQTGVTVAAFGYRTPGRTITAAPGQVLNVSVFGVNTRFAEAVRPIAGPTDLATEIRGVSAEFTQGTTSVMLRLWAIQQTPCPASGVCSPATTLTFQIPYQLDPAAREQATLKIRDNRTVVAEVAISPVLDRVHIMNTCDETSVDIGTAREIPAGTCAPIVAHANAQLVTPANPAKAGETLIIWVYGLGAVDRPIIDGCCADPVDIPRAAQPFTVSLSYASPGSSALSRLSTVAPTYAGGVTLSQVHFIAPEAPANLAACTATSGNLRVLLAGPSSADSADICLK